MARKTLGKMEFENLVSSLKEQNKGQLEAQRETTKSIRNLTAYFLKSDRADARRRLEQGLEAKKDAVKVSGKSGKGLFDKKVPSKGILGKFMDFFLTGALGSAGKGIFTGLWNSVKFSGGFYKGLAGLMGGLLLAPGIWESIKKNIEKEETFTGKMDVIFTEFLKKKIFSEDNDTRRLAAFALANSGKVGVSFIKEVLRLSPDPYVRINLSLGMLGHIDDNKLICEALYSFLMINHNKVMWSSAFNPLFQILVPTNVLHVPQVSRYPTMVDQLTRLEILNKLAVLDFEKAKEVLKSFLNNNIIGVSYAASTTLLKEGGEAAVTTLTNLLHADAANVRVQAALVLALSGESSKAVEVLQGCYHAVDREMKLEILHALGQIGDKKSVPFLIILFKLKTNLCNIVYAFLSLGSFNSFLFLNTLPSLSIIPRLKASCLSKGVTISFSILYVINVSITPAIIVPLTYPL